MNRLVYRCLRLIFVVQNFLLKQFTPIGQGVLACLLITAILSSDMTQNFYFLIFSLTASLLTISFIGSRLIRYRFHVKRQLPKYGTVGEKLCYRIVIENPTSIEQKGLTLLESVASCYPSYYEFENFIKRQQGWRDKIRAWQYLVALKQWAKEVPTTVPTLPTEGEVELIAELTPLRRGRLLLKSITLASADPLGLIYKVVSRSQPQSILILPKRYNLPEIEFPTVKRYQPGADSSSLTIGESVEFMSLRDYQYGDSPKKIHWKSWAKTGKPIVQETHYESSVRYAILLDAFQRSHPHLVEQAIAVTLSLVCELQSPNRVIDVIFWGPEGIHHTTVKNRTQIDSTLSQLATIEPRIDSSFVAVNQYLQSLFPQWNAYIHILSDWNEERGHFFAQLGRQNFPSKLLYITAVDQFKEELFTQVTLNLHTHLLRGNYLQQDLMRV